MRKKFTKRNFETRVRYLRADEDPLVLDIVLLNVFRQIAQHLVGTGLVQGSDFGGSFTFTGVIRLRAEGLLAEACHRGIEVCEVFFEAADSI